MKTAGLRQTSKSESSNRMTLSESLIKTYVEKLDDQYELNLLLSGLL